MVCLHYVELEEGHRAEQLAFAVCCRAELPEFFFISMQVKVLRGGEEFKSGFVFIGVNFGSKVSALACALAEA